MTVSDDNMDRAAGRYVGKNESKESGIRPIIIGTMPKYGLSAIIDV